MAKYTYVAPNKIMKDFEKLYDDCEKIFGAMCKAGAEVVLDNVKKNSPPSFADSEIMKCLKITQAYKTPSDDGKNVKVAFYGYFINSKGEITPAPLVANVFEYGSSKFTKYPYFRKSFHKGQIEKAMLQAQKNASGGLLDE